MPPSYRVPFGMRRKNLNLPVWVVDFYSVLGGGNFTRGIEIMAKRAANIDRKVGRPRKNPV